ncbi:MAG: hypothetical protein HY744_05775 [Deltaproteobacteria bacterium]|nr:hypothetical protein [Deltaproteobacteria bacterium]
MQERQGNGGTNNRRAGGEAGAGTELAGEQPRAPEPAPPAAPSGRLAMLSGMSLLVGLIPIPTVPDRVRRQVRGALAHDVLARRGISLTTDARAVLAAPNSPDRLRVLVRKAVEMLTRRLLRRLGPLAALSTVVSAFEIYALGHLLDRYARRHRTAGTLRLQAPEARRVRAAVDRAVLRAFSPAVTPRRLARAEGAEDFRDELTRWLDGLVLRAALLPDYVQRRLEAAFDEELALSSELAGAGHPS